MVYSTQKAKRFILVVCGVSILIMLSLGLSALGEAHAVAASSKLGQDKILTKSINDALPEIAIQLDGILPQDYVNIRTGNTKSLSVSAANLVLSGDLCTDCAARIGKPGFGDKIQDESLSITPNGVKFLRPQGSGNAVSVDIELGVATKVNIFINGEAVLTGVIGIPTAWKNGKWELGTDKKIEAFMRGMVSLLPGGVNAKVIDAKEFPFVPLAKVKILREPEFSNYAGRRLYFALQVDKKGNVVQVHPPTSGELDSKVEQIAKSYKFEPYLLDGQPSPFTVVISKRVP